MTTITLPEEIRERIEKAAALRGEDPTAYVARLLTDSLDADARDFEEACAAIAVGLAQAEAGQGRDWDEYVREQLGQRAARRAARQAGQLPGE